MQTRQEAERDLGPYCDRLHARVARAVEGYREPKHAGLLAKLSKRSHSSNRNDLIWQELMTEFEDAPQVCFIEKGNRRLMLVNRKYQLRVKKLDASLNPRNVLTQAVFDFLHQGFEQLRFPEMEEPMAIDLGYRFVGLAQEGFEVYLRRPRGLSSYEWLMPVQSSPDATGEKGVAVPQGPTPTPTPRVRPRQDEIAQDEEEPSGASDA